LLNFKYLTNINLEILKKLEKNFFLIRNSCLMNSFWTEVWAIVVGLIIFLLILWLIAAIVGAIFGDKIKNDIKTYTGFGGTPVNNLPGAYGGNTGLYGR
jgi:hypothetical protein